MKAYHNDPAIKEKYLARVKAHRLTDELVKGRYWEDGKGCAVGCTIHSGSHSAYETELGIPRILARLEDSIFESLPNGQAMLWPEAFLEAIHVGADLSMVGSQFLHWLLIDPTDGVIRFANKSKTRKAIQSVADLYWLRLDGNEPSASEWSAASTAAAAAYAAATADASASAAAYAAYAAADAADAAYAADAADAAAYAAYAAAYAAYAAAANSVVERKRQAEKLLELLRESKPGKTSLRK